MCTYPTCDKRAAQGVLSYGPYASQAVVVRQEGKAAVTTTCADPACDLQRTALGQQLLDAEQRLRTFVSRAALAERRLQQVRVSSVLCSPGMPRLLPCEVATLSVELLTGHSASTNCARFMTLHFR